jgi:elongation factor Ts
MTENQTTYKPTAADVKALRSQSGAGMLDVRNALVEAEGDVPAAHRLLRERGIAKAAKLGLREASEGLVSSYIHNGRKGALVEVNCNTDFVANTDDFKQFARDIAIQIVSTDSTRWVSRDEVPEEAKAEEISVYAKQAADEGKPEAIQKKIAEGRLDKWLKEVCLLDQPFFRDEDVTVEQARAQLSAETGENVVIRRFSRFELGSAG